MHMAYGPCPGLCPSTKLLSDPPAPNANVKQWPAVPSPPAGGDTGALGRDCHHAAIGRLRMGEQQDLPSPGQTDVSLFPLRHVLRRQGHPLPVPQSYMSQCLAQ